MRSLTYCVCVCVVSSQCAASSSAAVECNIAQPSSPAVERWNIIDWITWPMTYVRTWFAWIRFCRLRRDSLRVADFNDMRVQEWILRECVFCSMQKCYLAVGKRSDRVRNWLKLPVENAQLVVHLHNSNTVQFLLFDIYVYFIYISNKPIWSPYIQICSHVCTKHFDFNNSDQFVLFTITII